MCVHQRRVSIRFQLTKYLHWPRQKGVRCEQFPFRALAHRLLEYCYSLSNQYPALIITQTIVNIVEIEIPIYQWLL